ncbi:MAG TPA: type II toxin-antitoxin system HicA family toxin [Candidatus Eremiobacteraeota bacterium]|nr:MAG: YcfA-like protein [bacterium ADurb.Bin363]HPZ10555.1 type II toxin-antitoxin system HicA family toxin [Candidatus Eremiobacteraeota bacterium]
MIDKLRNKSASEIVSALIKDGFVLVRQRESHRTYSKGQCKVTVAYHHLRDTFPIGTLADIIKTVGWNENDCKKLGLIK